ncbi:hypothetical protein GCM10009101_01390 [Brevundimonas lenta]
MKAVAKNGGPPHRVDVDGLSFGRACRVHAHASEGLVGAFLRLLMRRFSLDLCAVIVSPRPGWGALRGGGRAAAWDAEGRAGSTGGLRGEGGDGLGQDRLCAGNV